VQHEEFLMALGIVHRGWKNAGSSKASGIFMIFMIFIYLYA
jgi:hypothetical protein